MSVFLSDAARNDLSLAWQRAAQISPSNADKQFHRLSETMEKLATFPGMGRARPDLSFPDLRYFPCDAHNIYYTETKNGVRIVRILPAKMDVSLSDF